MDSCIFCKIVKGDIPCYKIYEDSKYLVFLDAFPSLKGQTLVIPKKHVGGYLFKMKEDAYVDLMKISKRVTLAIDKALGSIKTGMVVEGLEVDHVHVKLYPLMERIPLDLNAKIAVSALEMEEIAKMVASEMNN